MKDPVSVESVEAAVAALVEPEVFPRADDDAQFQAILDRVRAGPDLAAKLAVAGFTLRPIEHAEIEQACETCMYYLVRRRWCDLPELDVPVEPHWSCRLWRM